MQRTPPYVAMANASDEIPRDTTGHDADQSKVVRLGKRKALAEPSRDKNLEKLAADVLNRSKEVIGKAAAAVEEVLSAVTELEAVENSFGHTASRMKEDREKHLQSAIIVERNKADNELVGVRTCGEELQDARKALIEGFLKYKLISKESADIGIKMMGFLEELPFKYACRIKYGNEDDLEAKASMLLSVWQKQLKNPSWRPFKTVEVDGKTQVVVDGDDAKLMQLRNEYGDIVFSAVKVAVAELREYSTAEGYPVPELWNFGEGRKATVVEALTCVFNHLKK